LLHKYKHSLRHMQLQLNHPQLQCTYHLFSKNFSQTTYDKDKVNSINRLILHDFIKSTNPSTEYRVIVIVMVNHFLY
jgi:hypothetical protein